MQVSSDMEKLTEEGINSFKFFLAYKGAMAVTDQQLLSGLRRSKELGALPLVSHLCIWCLPMLYFLQHFNLSLAISCPLCPQCPVSAHRKDKSPVILGLYISRKLRALTMVCCHQLARPAYIDQAWHASEPMQRP